MTWRCGGLLSGAALSCLATLAGAADLDRPDGFVAIDQNLSAEVLARYHHTDQGTRLLPAAWLAALPGADGGGFMDPENLRRFGFLVDDVEVGPLNPHGWPLGFTVSADPIPVAGFTCAMCHTGQIERQGRAVRIEGGQAMIDLPEFVVATFQTLAKVVQDKALRERFVADATAAGYPTDRIEADVAKAAAQAVEGAKGSQGQHIVQIETGRGRLDAVQGIANQVFGTDLRMPSNTKNLDAPVNFPYLWDIWRLSWLQYNGFLPPQPLSRNIGEVLGSRGATNIVEVSGALNPEPDRWRTSIQLDNLIWMEKTLQGLEAPSWPEDVLGPIDRDLAAAGRDVFANRCAGCHGIKELPDKSWDVTVVPLTHIGTDPAQATHWAARTYDATRIGMSAETPAYDLDVAINAIRRQLYADDATPAAEREGDVDFEAPCGYKARPLIGVWATPPFLHNGSVRTVRDLLSDTRPARFTYGTREYDPSNLGYAETPSLDDHVLDTTVPGNLNGGHWWTDEADRPGRIGPKLAEEEIAALIEYLKAASYEDYPREARAAPVALPCQGERDWARKS